MHAQTRSQLAIGDLSQAELLPSTNVPKVRVMDPFAIIFLAELYGKELEHHLDTQGLDSSGQVDTPSAIPYLRAYCRIFRSSKVCRYSETISRTHEPPWALPGRLAVVLLQRRNPNAKSRGEDLKPVV